MSTSTTAPATASDGPTFGAGAIAGAAVGCAIGGALIAALITWAIMSIRNKKKNRSMQKMDGGASAMSQRPRVPSKSAAAAPVAGAGAGAGAATAAASTEYLRNILPEIPEDSDVKRKTFQVLDSASIHVENFYSATPVQLSSDEVKPRVSSFNSSHMPGALWDLLRESQSTGTLITRALSETIVSSISPVAGQEVRSLLPGGLTAAFAASNVANKDIKAHAFEWRMLTMHLYNQGTDEGQARIARDALVLRLAHDFQAAFAPWRRPMYTAEQELQALVGLLNAAADHGVWLLGQRSVFVFNWQRNIPAGTIETRPALLKTTDASGKSLDRAQVILESEMGRI